MKINLIFFAALLITVFSCNSPESKLSGTWKVTNVETHFDENSMTPAMVSQVVEMQKETFFKILNDSVIIIMSSDNTHEAKWSFDEESGIISYYFETTPSTKNELGTLINGNIIAESEAPIGKMVITYAKEK